MTDGNASQKSLAEHVAQTREWAKAIRRFQAQGHDVIVGEWSLASGVHPGGQAWADAQLAAFSIGRGWFFWNYKKEGLTRDSDDWGGDTWSLRGAVAAGITGLAVGPEDTPVMIVTPWTLPVGPEALRYAVLLGASVFVALLLYVYIARRPALTPLPAQAQLDMHAPDELAPKAEYVRMCESPNSRATRRACDSPSGRRYDSPSHHKPRDHR